MPNLLYQVFTVVFDLVILVFVGFYLLNLRKKEKDLDKRTVEADQDYDKVVGNSMAQQHNIVQGAVEQSNQMMSIATHQANQILQGAQYISQTTKATLDAAIGKMVVDVESVGQNSRIALDQALQKMVTDVHREAFDAGKKVTDDHETTLKQIASFSITGFQNVTNELELELQKEIRQFRQEVLANIEKEVAEYKDAKMRRVDQASIILVQRVSQEVLNKSLTVSDHENLVIRSLERAKKEGVFD